MNTLLTSIASCSITFIGFLLLSYHAQAANTGTINTTNDNVTTSGNIQATMGTTSIEDDKEFIEAVNRMFSYGLTKYKTMKEYKASDIVTREQAAKFYSQFAVNVLYKVIDMTKYCEFSDINDADPSLRNSILTSCLLHLFHGKQNKFMPLQPISKAEALTVLVRSIDKMQDETLQPRYSAYHKRALELKLTKEIDIKQLETPVSRYEMALLLYRASKIKNKDR